MDPRYNPWAGKVKVDYASMRNDPRKLAAAQRDSDGMKSWANALPMIGTAAGGILGGVAGGIGGAAAGGVGAIPGAMAGVTSGMAAGGSLGNMGGAAINGMADAKLDPFREKEMRQQAMWMALQGMR